MFELSAEDEGFLSEVCRFVAGWGGDTSNFSIAASRAGGVTVETLADYFKAGWCYIRLCKAH